LGQPGHTGFFLFLFFLQPGPFQPWIFRVSGRPAGPDRVLKLWFELFFLRLKWLFFPLVFFLKKTTHTQKKNVSVLHHLISKYLFLMATFYITYIYIYNNDVSVYIYTVFKPGPVQGPRSGFWPGHQVGWVNSYLKKKFKMTSF